MRARRYKAEGPEAEFEPGSRDRVLRNRLGIRSVREMARRESEALVAATQQVIDETRVDQRFTGASVRRMHRLWLGEIYVWAGEYRQVNMGKGDFMFASAAQVPRLMQELERGALREFTPCRFASPEEQARALAVVHAELILIHPFREGNGRCTFARDADGAASWIAGARLRRNSRGNEAALYRGGACRAWPRLPADNRDLPRRDRPHPEGAGYRFFGEEEVLRENAPLRASRLNGARMPSMAEDVATDLSTVRLRTAGSRRYRLVEDSFELMAKLYQARLSS